MVESRFYALAELVEHVIVFATAFGFVCSYIGGFAIESHFNALTELVEPKIRIVVAVGLIDDEVAWLAVN